MRSEDRQELEAPSKTCAAQPCTLRSISDRPLPLRFNNTPWQARRYGGTTTN